MREFSTIALIVAAGSGKRLGSTIAKQYINLHDKPLLRHSVETFLAHPEVDAVVVVINPDDKKLYEKATAGLSLLPPISGGQERQDSVRLGLTALAAYKPTRVLIHDAARPFVSQAIITDVLNALKTHKAAIPALPCTDTIKEAAGGVLTTTLDRAKLYAAQTPQGFDFATILSLHQNHKSPATDDAALAEAAGIPVGIVPGEKRNIKITTAEDLMTATTTETRVGMGYDVHRFKSTNKNNPIMLCGIAVPHDKAIEAHSDGDVGIHAAVDALLGAIVQGDIGVHFPPTDKKWKDASSDQFLTHTRDLVTQAGGKIIHLDITFLCERPKIRPHVEAMRARMAELLAISPSRVSIKATTTEQLGFLGREEGIAAQAVATVVVSH